jgi:DNA-directed RNA polymerase subunit RPC12/RpoP
MDNEPEITFEWECSMCGAINWEEVDPSSCPPPELYRCEYCGHTHDGSEFLDTMEWLEDHTYADYFDEWLGNE